MWAESSGWLIAWPTLAQRIKILSMEQIPFQALFQRLPTIESVSRFAVAARAVATDSQRICFA